MNKEENNKRGKYKISTRPISYTKELFLVLCLVGRELSPKTVKLFKQDYGEYNVRRNVIYNLVHRGLIKKVGYRKSYSYMLTDRGFKYLMIKFPYKYNYELYKDYNEVNMYNEKIRERNRALTSVLYCLVKQGVSIENYSGIAEKLFQGYEIKVEKPFFVSVKEMRSFSPRLGAIFSSSSYGCIVTQQNITIIYAPDKEHHLWLSNEVEWKRVVCDILEQAVEPYNNRQNLGVLYLYNDVPTAKDSYEVNATRIDNRSPQTRRCYQKLNYIHNYSMIMDNMNYKLSDVLDSAMKDKISRVFFDECDLRPYHPTIDTQFCDGVYGGETLSSMMWYLDPTKMMQIIEYIIQTRNQVLILCFTEQVDTISNIISINKSLKGKVLVYDLSREAVISAITQTR